VGLVVVESAMRKKLKKKEGESFSDLEGNPFWVVDENCP